ncbi:hypothetical protein [Streptomyces sp. SAJ15]|uniref:hypothetical protein n=1 Tax=Streptomyces sp. SAJ15 TaxID=2011095 RepID=UPI0021B2BE20|nr:hypothetical protein [Streptomyces sp. SAJ15]
MVEIPAIEGALPLRRTARRVWRPPAGSDIEAQPAGRWWDAVRVPTLIGERALSLLGGESGPVIEDTYGAVWYWLVPLGAAADWTLQRVLSEGAYVAVPPLDRTLGPGPHWRVPFTSDRCLTDAARLHTALLAAMTTVKHCQRCERLTADAVAVGDVHGASGAGRTFYACAACAPCFPRRRDPLAELAATRRALREGRA